jgi:hypothetical protein
MEAGPRRILIAAVALAAAVLTTMEPRGMEPRGFSPGDAPPQDPAPPPDNDTCLACHNDPALEGAGGKKIGLDAAAFGASMHGAIGVQCVDCHVDLKASPEFPHASPLKPAECATCHPANVDAYADSIHARGRTKSGLVVAPNCASCHGTHDIKPMADPASRVNRAHVPQTCGTCHKGIETQYAGGVHGRANGKGDTLAPVCSDCHTAHKIQRADVTSWQLDVIRECGTCHADKIKTYRDTFHGQVTSLGFVRVATCAACHGAHSILPSSDPQSMTSRERIVSTCQQCHANATESFAQYDPHADKNDRARNPSLFWASRFMTWLLVGVFGFFGLHAALWFPRGFIERRRAKAAQAAKEQQNDERA